MARTTHDKSERLFEDEEYQDELQWQRRQAWLWPWLLVALALLLVGLLAWQFLQV
jgi:hypothetical protein